MATINGTAGNDDLSSSTEGDVILGLGGEDTLSANAVGITLDGGAGNDSLFSSGGATLIGGPGDDLMISTGTNDTVSYANDPAGVTVDLLDMYALDGSGGIDTLLGIANVTGSAFDDTLIGDDLANVLQGGAGDDTLTGNGGADVFKFSFALESGSGGGDTPSSFGEWLTSEHALNIGNLHQNEFVQNYKGWLGYLAEDLRVNYGFNTIPENAKVSFKQNDSGGTSKIEGLTQANLDQIFGDVTAISVKTGKTSQDRYYSDIDTSSDIWGGGGEVTPTSGDGFDTINDFALGEDQLEFNGLAGFTLDEFDSFFDVTSNGVDTTLALADDSWSVTLVGVSANVADIYGASLFS